MLKLYMFGNCERFFIGMVYTRKFLKKCSWKRANIELPKKTTFMTLWYIRLVMNSCIESSVNQHWWMNEQWIQSLTDNRLHETLFRISEYYPPKEMKHWL